MVNMKRKKISFYKSLFLITMMKKNTFICSSKPLAMKKKKRTCAKSFQRQHQSLSSIIPQTEFYLPDECWEHVFTFLIYPVDTFLVNPFHSTTEDINKRNFKSLSLVSKHFLSITNRLIFSITIYHPQLCFLPRFIHRFSNLNSLDLWFGSADLDADIAFALRDRPTLKSLSLSGIELNHAKYVTSHYIDSFLSFKSLNSLKFSYSQISDHLLYSIATEGLPLKTFVLENCMGYTYHGIYDLFSKCQGIQHLGLQGVDFLTNHYVFRLSLLLPNLISINLSRNSKLRELALFTLIKNCYSLDEIRMEYIYIWQESVEYSDTFKDFDVNPRIKSLHLSNNTFINDKTILLLASTLPNIQVLDLSYCHDISKKSICQVLSRCPNVRCLNLSNSNEMRGLKMNFIVHQLELLDISYTNIDDKTLYKISKSCCGLLELNMIGCKYITKKGVMCVVENCTQLKEIYIMDCDKVNANVVVSMLSSLKKNKRSIPILYM